ncbi:MAG: exodeoxyribonuclease VII large subunit [Candidatus Cyclobacteriaceae bacterium M3_2C_046]
MPETLFDKKIFSLLEVTRSIQKTLSQRYTSAFWVKAEMIKLNHYSRSGHCYPEMVEKTNGKVVAQIRCNLWKDNFININRKFLEVLKEPLKDGIKILFLARITFDPAYGLSLNILDIDPGFTLGDLEKDKQLTIERLQKEGIFSLNQQLAMPLLPQRLAIISVETSKGYADFTNIIDHNEGGYQFFHLLFPSVLQGDNAIKGIIKQLKRIKKVIHHFDVVLIVRGGGGDIGLSCYNDYELARHVASFPLPVLAGIGHATNQTVTEMVAHYNAITPTKLAEYLIHQFDLFADPVQNAQKVITEKSNKIIRDEHHKFSHEIRLFKSAAKNVVQKQQHQIKSLINTLNQHAFYIFRNEKRHMFQINQEMKKASEVYLQKNSLMIEQQAVLMQKDVKSILHRSNGLIDQYIRQISKTSRFVIAQQNTQTDSIQQRLIEKARLFLNDQNKDLDIAIKSIHHLDPKNVLKRGYSITLLDGKSVTNVERLKQGDVINSVLYQGTVTSKIEKIKKSESNE